MSQRALRTAVDGDSYEKYIACGKEALARLLDHPQVRNCPEMRGRTGCCIYLCPVDEPRHTIVWHLIGQVPEDKRDKYFAHAQEKPHRLAKHHYLMLSYECRNEAYLQYGGAIRGEKYFHGVSGLTEDADEMLALLNAHLFRDIDLRKVRDYLDRRNALEMTLHDGTKIPLKPNAFAGILYDLNNV